MPYLPSPRPTALFSPRMLPQRRQSTAMFLSPRFDNPKFSIFLPAYGRPLLEAQSSPLSAVPAPPLTNSPPRCPSRRLPLSPKPLPSGSHFFSSTLLRIKYFAGFVPPSRTLAGPRRLPIHPLRLHVTHSIQHLYATFFRDSPRSSLFCLRQPPIVR